MNSLKKFVRLIVGLVFSSSVLFASPVMAAAYGIQGEQTAQSQAINQLLSNNNDTINAMIDGSSARPRRHRHLPTTPIEKNPNDKVTDPEFGPTNASQKAFIGTVHNLMPLSPNQIRTLHYLFSRSQQAAAEYPGTPPKPTSSTVLVNLSPGAAPPIVRLRAGYVTSLVFLDSTDQPWPIIAYDIGDPKAFSLEPNQPDGKSNTLLVQALENYKEGNLAVMLKGQDTPIMISLLAGQTAVDYRVDLHIPGLGPNANILASGLPATENAQLINFLDGVPPQDAQTLTVSGADNSQAWLYNGKLYLRTRLTVLSPSWMSTMSSPDGTHVYEMMKTPIVLASLHGQMIQLAIKGL